MTTNTTNTDQHVAQSETPEQIATKVVNQIAVGAWQYCSRQWVIGLVTEALRNEREACAKAICNLCRRHEDYHPAKRDDDKIWRHERIGHEAEWTEHCLATAIREGR